MNTTSSSAGVSMIQKENYLSRNMNTSTLVFGGGRNGSTHNNNMKCLHLVSAVVKGKKNTKKNSFDYRHSIMTSFLLLLV